MNENEILDEIHRGRAEHARQMGYDIHKMFQQIREGTKKLKAEGWKIVSFGEKAKASYALREEPKNKAK